MKQHTLTLRNPWTGEHRTLIIRAYSLATARARCTKILGNRWIHEVQ